MASQRGIAEFVIEGGGPGSGSFNNTFAIQIDHKVLVDDTNNTSDLTHDQDYATRVYTYLTERFFVDNAATYVFSSDPSKRVVNQFRTNVSDEKFSFVGATNAAAAKIIQDIYDPYRIGRTFGIDYVSDQAYMSLDRNAYDAQVASVVAQNVQNKSVPMALG